MSKLKFYFILVIFMLLPINVFAYEFNCEGEKYYVNDSFMCTLSTGFEPDPETIYDSIKGKINLPNEIECSVTSIGDGLSRKNITATSFELEGSYNSEFVLKYNCKVKKDVAISTTKQIVINDFVHHLLYSDFDSAPEILRSNNITLIPESDKTKEAVKDNRSRDTSNPDSLLKSLSIENIDLTFSKFLTTYDKEVLFDVDKANISFEANNPDAKVTIEGDTNLSIGMNTIDIKVVSPDGNSTTYYTLNITRLARGEEIYYIEKDATLKTLDVEGYPIKFDKDIYEYSIKIPYDVESVKVNVRATSDDATISKNAPDKLVNGSIITINVKSADGSNELKYKITIHKDTPKKDYSLYFIIGGFVFVLAVLIYVIIYNNKKKQKRDPILKLKNDKRRLNKGNKFDHEMVPDSGTAELLQEAGIENLEPQSVISASDVNLAAMPMQATEVQDTNLNKTTSVVSTIDLTASEKAQPMAVTQPQGVVQPVQPQPQVQAVVPPVQTMQPVSTPQPVQPQTPQQVMTTPVQSVQMAQPQVVTQQPVQQVATQPVQQVMQVAPVQQVVPNTPGVVTVQQMQAPVQAVVQAQSVIPQVPQQNVQPVQQVVTQPINPQQPQVIVRQNTNINQ